MAEDNGLCTYEKHHKQKILLFLSSMRSYADSLKKNRYKLDYLKIETKILKMIILKN
jgi:deoxyribodipyrimidine photolyase-related protein